MMSGTMAVGAARAGAAHAPHGSGREARPWSNWKHAMRALRALNAALAVALVAACASSPPSRFYTLSDTAPEGAPKTVSGSITISGVTIPGEIDRPELVRRVSPTQLSISELDRWAAPLDEMIRRVLADDVARRVPNPTPGQQHAVFVDIHELYGDVSCNVTLRAVWTLKEPGQAANEGQSVSEEVRVPSSGSCPATLPEGMSVALGQLSDRIVAAVAR